MIKLSIQTKGRRELQQRLGNVSPNIKKRQRANFHRVGILVKKRAQRYSKISPIDDPDRGALQRAIRFKTGKDYVKIFVPRNSDAGSYAFLQHEVIEGRGTGTIRKGSKAGWKFISRAIIDEQKNIRILLLDDPVIEGIS